MTDHQQHKNFAIKASLVASLGALALLAVQNASLNTQISNLQMEVNANRIDGNMEETFGSRRGLMRKVEHPSFELVDFEDSLDELQDEEDNYRGLSVKGNSRRRLGKSSGSSKGKGSKRSGSKSSKRSSPSSSSSSSVRCSSSSTNDSADRSSGDVSQAKCEDLRQLVFDLETEVTNLEGETLRFTALADELTQTSIIASGEATQAGERRKLSGEAYQYSGHIEDSLRALKNQEALLKNGNERVTELNGVLRQSAFGWLGVNANLTEENLELLKNITWLTEENYELLNAQTKLSEQIRELNATLDNYQNLLDNHSDLNGELNQTTLFLQQEIDRLSKENEEYKQLNEDLSNSIDDLTDQNTELAKQNEILAGLNKDLNQTIDRLEDNVSDLSAEIDRLESNNADLKSEVDRLENVTSGLEQINNALEEKVAGLTEQVGQFSDKVDELQKYNDELENIVSFVNETSGYLDETMDSVTEYLSDQIVAYRSVATETLQNTFIQRAALWDCAYRQNFGDDAFSANDKLPIPANKFDDVMNYVNDRVLGELCLSLEDFEDFLEHKFDDPVYTTNHIVSGIASYTYLAFNHYFPDSGETGGLTEADWATAGYNCERLPADKQFLHGDL